MKCPSCGYENREDAQYCNLCQSSFLREPSAPYGLPSMAEPSKEAKKAVKQVLKSQAAGENWFQRHLNWTWVLPQLVLFVVAMVVMYGFIASMGPALIMAPTEIPSVISFLPFSIFIVAYAIILPLLGAASIYGIGAWVLKRKDRSLWWLLIFLIPTAAYLLNAFVGFVALVVVWIVFLRLENRNLMVDLPVSSGSSGSSSAIQPGLAPQGLGSQYRKYEP